MYRASSAEGGVVDELTHSMWPRDGKNRLHEKTQRKRYVPIRRKLDIVYKADTVDTLTTHVTTVIAQWWFWWLMQITRPFNHSLLSTVHPAANSKSFPDALSVWSMSNARQPLAHAWSSNAFLNA